MSEFFILSYHRMNQIIADRDGVCFGFDGREIDYADYVREAKVKYAD